MISVPEAGSLPRMRPPDGSLERLHDLRREPVRVQREWLVEPDAHHLPVPGRRVLPRGTLRRAAVSGSRLGSGRHPFDAREQPQTERLEHGHVEPPTARAVFASVSEPSSRYAAASGASPTPQESQTTTSTRGTSASVTRRLLPACSRCTAAPTAGRRVARRRSLAHSARTYRTCRPRSSRAHDRRRGGWTGARAQPRSLATAPRCCAIDRRIPHRRRRPPRLSRGRRLGTRSRLGGDSVVPRARLDAAPTRHPSRSSLPLATTPQGRSFRALGCDV